MNMIILYTSMFELDEEKIEKATSEEVTIQCDLANPAGFTQVKPAPLECVFEVKLHRFRDYGLGHELYSPPLGDYEDVFPQTN